MTLNSNSLPGFLSFKDVCPGDQKEAPRASLISYGIGAGRITGAVSNITSVLDEAASQRFGVGNSDASPIWLTTSVITSAMNTCRATYQFFSNWKNFSWSEVRDSLIEMGYAISLSISDISNYVQKVVNFVDYFSNSPLCKTLDKLCASVRNVITMPMVAITVLGKMRALINGTVFRYKLWRAEDKVAFLERKVLATAKRKLDKYENYRAKLLSHAIALHNSRCERQFGLDGREAQSLETLYRDKSNLRNELLQHLKLDANCTLSTLELVGLKIEIEKSQARKEKKFTKVLGENCYDVLFKAATKQQIGDVPGLINRVKAESTKRLTIHSSSLVMSLGLGCITVLSILLKFGRVVPLVSLICSGLSLAIGAGRIGLETWKMQEIFEGPVGKYDRHFIIAGMVFGVLSLAATIGITFFLSGPLLPAFVAILATIVAFGFSYYSLHLVKKKEERYQAWLASNK